MSGWLDDLQAQVLGRRGEPGVLVTVAETRGSTPRGVGTRMLVTRDACSGTIGGGNLEFKAIEIAREALADVGAQRVGLRRFPLGPSLGQCCGGVAVLLFEPVAGNSLDPWLEKLLQLRRTRQKAVMVSLTRGAAGAGRLIVTANEYFGGFRPQSLNRQAVAMAREMLAHGGQAGLRTLEPEPGQMPALLFEPLGAGDFHIVLFGAGHVGKALVQVLSGLPCTLSWVDSRAHEFPQQLPANVTAEISDAPEYDAADAPPGSYFLIMTHSHALDQLICERVLQRTDFSYCGLIGSASKLRKFQKRMRARGLSEQALAGLTCPIGVAGISGKHPAEIAVAVAAQLLQAREQIVRSEDLSGAHPGSG